MMHFHRKSSSRSAFTLIELLVVIAIIAILSVVVILTLNPAELLRQSRDANRVSDMSTLTSGINLYVTDQSAASNFSFGSSSVVYVSIPDPSATSTAGDQCQGLGLISLPATYTYHCAASSTSRLVNGTGWIPVNLSAISSGSPFGSLPVDPINASSSRLYYTYTTNGTQFEVTSPMESAKYKLGGTGDVIGPDGSSLSTVYAKGTNLALEPLDYGDSSLIGFWPLNEGTGTIAYDDSGNNATGTWNGTATGNNSTYYTSGKTGTYAGIFDGSTDGVTMSVNPPTSATTLTAWIYKTSYGSSGGYPTIFGNPGGARLYFNGGSAGDAIYFNIGGGNVFQGGTPSNELNAWHFLAATYNGSVVNFYVDGVSVASTTASGAIANSGSESIGSWAGVSGDYSQGRINDARIYNRALSAAEIAAMYNGVK